MFANRDRNGATEVDRKLNIPPICMLNALVDHYNDSFFSAHVNAEKAICLVNQAKHHLLRQI